MRRFVLMLVLAMVGLGQSQVDMQSQVKNVNFSAAPYTRPMKTGTALPGACVVGDMYFKTDATAGSNVYACTAANIWTVETGGSGTAGSRVAATAVGGALTIGADCSVSTPCNLRFTNRVVTLTTSAVATLGTGAELNGVYVFLDATTGRITLASATAVINCDANCDAVSGVGFRADSLPLFQWPVSIAGVWDTFQPLFDKRAAQSNAPVIAGNNITVAVANGKQVVSYDATSGLNPTGPVDATGASVTKPNRTVGSDPSGACTNANEIVLSTASGNLFSCLGATWHKTSGATVSGAGSGRVAVLDVNGNVDPTVGGNGFVTWDGFKMTVPGAANFNFNNANSGATCSGALAMTESQSNVFKITLTGNCAASSTAPQAGQMLTFLICQDATGSRTFSWPANYHGAMTVGATASKCSAQQFVGNGTDYYAVGAGVGNQ